MHHLEEGHHRRRVDPGHPSEVDHQEPQRPGLHTLSDPLEQGVGRAEEHEPVHAQDLDGIAEGPERRPFGRRSVHVGVVGLPERDLAHQLDPAVVDREQHDREHQADHHAGQEPLADDRGQDHEHDPVLDRRQDLALVPDPLDQEGEAQEHQHARPRSSAGSARSPRRRTPPPRAGPSAAISPATRASTFIRSASAVRLSVVVPGDPAQGAGDHVQQPGAAQLLVRVQVPIQHDLGPADVEQDRDHGHEHRGRDPRPLAEHRRPVGAA